MIGLDGTGMSDYGIVLSIIVLAIAMYVSYIILKGYTQEMHD